MPLIALGVVLLLPALLLLLLPLALALRYRAGSARRRARGWLLTLNALGFALSSALFLVGAAVASLWIAGTFTHALLGLASGAGLGVLGVAWTRFERGPDALHFTPNRALALAITLVVAARIGYGFWRAWHAWHSGAEGWLAASGAAGALAAAGLVLGYSLVYSLGVHRKLRAHERAWVGRGGGS